MNTTIIAGQAKTQVLTIPEARVAEEPVFKCFQALIPELQELVRRQLDMPTRFSFAWTCHKYYGGVTEEFDCFAFADKCAELGYRALLEYSVERGAPFDEHCARVAARHGQLEILEYYAPRRNGLPEAEYAYRSWAEEAAENGQTNILEWLDIDGLFVRFGESSLDNFLYACSKGGLVEYVIRLIGNLSKGSNIPRIWQYIYAANSHGHLELAMRLRQLAAELGDPGSDKSFYSNIFDASFRYGHAQIAAWAIEQCPSVITEKSLKEMIVCAIVHGFIDILRLAKAHGGAITIDSFVGLEEREGNKYFCLSAFESIRYLHEKFGLDRSPFSMTFEVPVWATPESMQWMKARGYQFEFATMCTEDEHLPDKKLVTWFLEQGFKPSSKEFVWATMDCRFDILDQLWPFMPAGYTSDDRISHVLGVARMSAFGRGRYHFGALFKTIKWLRDKGFPWQPEACDNFVFDLCKHKPRVVKMYMREIIELNMPLSNRAQDMLNSLVPPKGIFSSAAQKVNGLLSYFWR